MVMGNPVSEAAREREAFRFASYLYNRADGAASSPGPVSPQAKDSLSILDPCLNAFAQLGSFRLNAARCLISIFDREYQYVVADSTSRAVEATDISGKNDTGLQGAVVSRPTGACEHVLSLHTNVPDSSGAANPSSNPQAISGTLPITIVPDLQDDDRFRGHEKIHCEPSNRFYTGVPIRSPRGVNIGVYCVTDDKPRDGLEDEQIQFLRSISQTITGYFESRRMNENYGLTERMVRGIGSFFEGKTAMSTTMIGSNTATGDAITAPQQYKYQAHLEDEKGTQTLHSQANLASAHASSWLNMTTPQQASVQGQDADERSIQQPDISTMMQIDNSHSVSAKTSTVTPLTRSGASMLGTATGSLDEDPRDLQVKTIFERAANIIRESIGVEGVIFLDASVGMFGGLIPSHQRDSNSTSSLDTDESSLDEASPEKSTKELNCGLLGHSIAIGEDAEEEKMDPLRFVFKEKVLQTLLRRYPMGRVFNFDRDFLLQSGDSEEDKGSIPGLQDTERHTGRYRPKHGNRQPPLNEGETMSAAIPGARSVALVPLWDSHRERWFAGALAWTRAPARFFTAESELTYLRAFGMTIMTEVARIDAMHAEKVKSNLLGSLSHELRSPLHGIAASVELMQDTDLDTLQEDILHAMESCSRTLLDVIDHLLDYSNISKMVRLSKSRDKNARHNRGNVDEKHQAFESLLTPIVSNVELDGLVEETAESVFAGYNHQKVPIAQLMQRGSLVPEDINTFQRLEPLQAAESFGHLLEGAGGMQHTPSPIDVYLDIDPQASWFRHTRPGALRRIMMNILGNSLKYTKSGYIILSLRQEQMPGKNNSRRTNLKLTITDTGRGMSEEFLQNRLYLPFAQEDALSPGTGLGLSIVHQLTKTIGGTIQVQSKVGRGTSICVTLPLPSSPPLPSQQSTFTKNVELLKNLRIRLRGLKESNTASGLPSIAAPTEQNIIQKLCLDWLGMEVVSTESSHIRADLIICSDMALSTITSGDLHSTSCPVVVLCRDAVSAHNHSTANKASNETRIFEFISQPVGPRKLARVLVLALTRWHDFKELSHLPTSSDHVDRIPDLGQPALSSTPKVRLDAHSLEQIPQGSSLENAPEVNSSGDHASGGDVRIDQSSTTKAVSAPSITGKYPKDTGARGRRYLLVDDNRINLQVLAALMRKLNLPYTVASNGLEALESYSTNSGEFCCVLMGKSTHSFVDLQSNLVYSDISMPVMDGLESTRRIREHEQTRQLAPATIIALTGLASASARQEAFASGVDLFMTKPVRLKQLTETLTTRGLT